MNEIESQREILEALTSFILLVLFSFFSIAFCIQGEMFKVFLSILIVIFSFCWLSNVIIRSFSSENNKLED